MLFQRLVFAGYNKGDVTTSLYFMHGATGDDVGPTLKQHTRVNVCLNSHLPKKHNSVKIIIMLSHVVSQLVMISMIRQAYHAYSPRSNIHWSLLIKLITKAIDHVDTISISLYG